MSDTHAHKCISTPVFLQRFMVNKGVNEKSKREDETRTSQLPSWFIGPAVDRAKARQTAEGI